MKRTACPGLSQGVCNFFVHALVEIVCFALLRAYFTAESGLLWGIALCFDFFAFVPQGLIGSLFHRHGPLDLGSAGSLLMLLSLFLIGDSAGLPSLLGLVLLALGNALLHEAGAISTTARSGGRLFHSALFVAGGSFGVVTGQYLGGLAGFDKYWLILPLALIEALVLLTNRTWLKKDPVYPVFALVKAPEKRTFITLAAFGVTAARSFIGYAIPISWRKEVWQSFLLFAMMGAGKALGGWLSDRFGARRVGVASTLLCIPFLLFGKDLMLVSILGVFCFSLTMSITFGMLLSIGGEKPGTAFGVTTLGLFTGLLPVFLFGSFGYLTNGVLILVLSLGSAWLLNKTLN